LVHLGEEVLGKDLEKSGPSLRKKGKKGWRGGILHKTPERTVTREENVPEEWGELNPFRDQFTMTGGEKGKGMEGGRPRHATEDSVGKLVLGKGRKTANRKAGRLARFWGGGRSLYRKTTEAGSSRLSFQKSCQKELHDDRKKQKKKPNR